MPGGRLNPFSVMGQFGDTADKAKDKKHEKSSSLRQKMSGSTTPYVDLSIKFMGASGLPKMDVVGSADPYFVAKLDDAISFVSTVKQNTVNPMWNENWKVKNVPVTAELVIKIMDKDQGSVTDDFIGFIKTSVDAGEKEHDIEGPSLFRRKRGTVWFKVESTPAEDDNPSKHPYLFNGPIRFSRHSSLAVGALTNLNEARLYSTWKMYIMGIPLFFGDVHQHWNKHYKAAQSIFQGPTSLVVRSGVQAGHRMLYQRTASNNFGVIEDSADIKQLLHGNGKGSNAPGSKFADRVKPAVYTYIISSEDDSFRFSETGAAFFTDFASKHALHANCYETVRYSGEFHPRPQGGWDKFSDDIPDESVKWELVIDNNSGTYAPDKKLLPKVKGLLEYNFPGFTIFALDHREDALKESREACRAYALKYRGVKQDELQPHAHAGVETLSHQAQAEAQASPSNQKAVASG